MSMDSMSMTASSSMDSMMSAMSTMASHMSSMSMAMSSAMTGSMSMPAATSSMPMSMSGMSMPMSTSSGGHQHGGGGMGGMHMGKGECSMEMAWNWKTIDTCFISRGWHVKTSGQFAGTCIGVFLWVVILCILSRIRRGLDSYIMHNGVRKMNRDLRQQGLSSEEPVAEAAACANGPAGCSSEDTKESTAKVNVFSPAQSINASPLGSSNRNAYRPNIFEQVVRALLYGLEYSITWLLALIIMSYNGYVIISAFLGATLGFLIVNWEKMKPMGSEPFTAQLVCC